MEQVDVNKIAVNSNGKTISRLFSELEKLKERLKNDKRLFISQNCKYDSLKINNTLEV